MNMRQFFYQTTYRRVKDESHIHWHHEEIPVLLREAVQSLNGSGMVLDIGCGTGVNSVFMAQQGLDVTAIDFVPEALEFARRRAEKFGVDVNFIRADVTKFDAPVKYDLIVDAGCFHGFDDKARMAYKERLLSWLSDNSNYLLIHLGKRHVFDFGILGPHAKTKSEIEPLLSGC